MLYNVTFFTSHELAQSKSIVYFENTTSCGKAADKAWSRLRTGKGTKPENDELRKVFIQHEKDGGSIWSSVRRLSKIKAASAGK
jgi:hypothetical protein